MRPTIASHILIKDGMPYVGKVLRQVEPYMDKMFIALSENSTDGSIKEVEQFVAESKTPIEFLWENVSNRKQLTTIQQLQVDRTVQDWILFLCDDDYWPKDQLEKCLDELDKREEVLAYSVSPYQLLDMETYDSRWDSKYFSKFLRNVDGLHYERTWPDEMPSDKDGNFLYHRTHKQVMNLPYKFYHLSYLKDHSFRTEDWAAIYGKDYKKRGEAIKLSQPLWL